MFRLQYFQMIALKLNTYVKVSPTWICRSMQRDTTSSGWKLKLFKWVHPLTTRLNCCCTIAEIRLIYDVIVISCIWSRTYPGLFLGERSQIPNISGTDLSRWVNPYPAKLNLYNFQSPEVVSRYCDPQSQVVENYWYLFNLGTNIWNSWCLDTYFIPNNSELVD